MSWNVPWRPCLSVCDQILPVLLADEKKMTLAGSVSPRRDQLRLERYGICTARTYEGHGTIGSSGRGRLALSRTPSWLHLQARIDALMTQPAVSHECGIRPSLVILGGSGLPRSGIESGATLRCPGKVDGSLPLSALLWRSHLPQAQRDKIFESTREDRIRLPRPSPMVRYLGSLHDPSPTTLGPSVRSTYTSE